MVDGLTDILWDEIRVILKTEVKDAYDQTLKDMDEVILLEGNDKGETGTPSPKINKKKEVMSIHGDTEDNLELFQSFPKSTGANKSKLAIDI